MNASSPLTHCQATKLLAKLAANPIDLTKGALTSERLQSFVAVSDPFKLLYGTERVTEEVVSALFALAEEKKAVELMERMQAGEILNFIEGYPSENRAALHTATRDFFEDPQAFKAASTAANLARHELNKLSAFLDKTAAFKNLVLIGIGGSELGPKALYLALEAYKKPERNVYFVGNIDPDELVKVFSSISLKETLVVVVSKSGTTLETSVNEAFARDLFEKRGIAPKEHFVAVTAEGSPMDNTRNYLEIFHIWDWIGGRYSATSAIGGVVIGFGISLTAYMDLLRGAHAMDRTALLKDPQHNLPLLAALLTVWNHNFLHIQTTAVIPYSSALARFPAHLQQLEMESNGKQVDKQGRFVDYATSGIIWGEPGTNAQHSFFQLIHQGMVPIAIEFIGFKHSQYSSDFTYEGTTSQQKLLANLFAQAISLAKGAPSDNPNRTFLGNRPSSILLGEKLNPYTLGALLSYYEHKVAFEGFIWNINSFDQEGVQLGKVLANSILDRIKSGNSESNPLADALLSL